MLTIYFKNPESASSCRLRAKFYINWRTHLDSVHRALRPISLVTLFLTLAAGVANAQAVLESTIMARPVNFTKEGTSTACGYRIAIQSPHDGSKGRRILDSLLIQKTDVIISKFEGKKLPEGVTGLKNMVPVKTYGGWFKVPGKRPARTLTEIPEGVEPPPSSLHLVDPEGAVEVFDAISRGQPIHVGVRWEPNVETIYVGKVEITQSMIDQFNVCLGELKTNFIKQPKGGPTS